uniref:hypothetical protein n=1 Tax=Ruminococcus sp. TaxID=41978 RepID=UPI00386E7FBF
MKKRAIISMVLAMTMLAGCAKTEKIQETTEETTSETTVETTEATPTPTATPTPRPTATPTPTPAPTSAPRPPQADDYDPEIDYYAKTMELVQSHEEENPGENRYFSYCPYGSRLSIYVIHPDNTFSEYVLSDGEFIVRQEDELQSTTYEDYTLDAEAFMQIPCVYHMDNRAANAFVQGAPEDGVYTGSILAMTDDMSTVIIGCSHFIQFDGDYAQSLEIGDVVEIPEMEDATVVDIDRDLIFLDNDFLIRNRCANTGDEDGWYLAYYGNDMAVTVSSGAYELPISSSCTINETSPFDEENETLAGYQDAIAASSTPLAAS